MNVFSRFSQNQYVKRRKQQRENRGETEGGEERGRGEIEETNKCRRKKK
jgi:hypothetical protein